MGELLDYGFDHDGLDEDDHDPEREHTSRDYGKSSDDDDKRNITASTEHRAVFGNGDAEAAIVVGNGSRKGPRH